MPPFSAGVHGCSPDGQIMLHTDIYIFGFHTPDIYLAFTHRTGCHTCQVLITHVLNTSSWGLCSLPGVFRDF